MIPVPDVTKSWRMAAGRPGEDEPIIGPMTPNAMKLWGRRVLRPAAKAASGREDVTLYTLRHSHASALHYAGPSRRQRGASATVLICTSAPTAT